MLPKPSIKPVQQTFFEKLKGGPMTLLILFGIHNGIVTYQEMEQWTEWSRPSLRKYLIPLFTMGIIQRVTDNRFRLTSAGEQLFLWGGAEKFFQQEEEAINLINELSIDSSSWCKTFSATDEIKEYLKGKGVLSALVDEIAYLCENDLAVVKSYFDHLTVGVAVWRLKNGEEPPKTEEKDWYGKYICRECGQGPCACEEED